MPDRHDTQAVNPQTPERVVDRLLTHRIEVGGCWISTYSTGSHGYSQIGYVENGRRVMRLGHRVAYEAFHGPIPDGLTVDHMCRTRRCINPLHLRLLTNEENARDNGNANKTHCPHGHPYDAENTYHTPAGDRRCRACAKARRLS